LPRRGHGARRRRPILAGGLMLSRELVLIGFGVRVGRNRPPNGLHVAAVDIGAPARHVLEGRVGAPILLHVVPDLVIDRVPEALTAGSPLIGVGGILAPATPTGVEAAILIIVGSH